MFYTPKKRHDLDSDCLDRLQADLTDWSTTLNSYCQMEYDDSDDSDDISRKVLRVHRAAIKLVYLLAQEAFHRPLAFPAGLQQQADPAQCNMEDSARASRSSVIKAALEISDILTTFREQNLLEYLPPLSVGCTLTAVASFLVEIRLAKRSSVELPIEQYHQCIRIILRLREIWPVARGTCAMISQMATNKHLWFARTLVMLSEPTPVSSNEASPDESHNSHNSGLRKQHQRSESRSSRADSFSILGTLEGDTTSALSQLSHDQASGNLVHNSSMASTYLASMYPFPWTIADLDFYNDFDPITDRELFMDQALNTYDPSSFVDCNMSGYTSSMAPTGEDVADVSAAMLPEGWRSRPPRP